LGELRRATLETLATLLPADAGHWAWGRGHPASASIVPVAFINFGYTESELAATYQFGLDPRMRDEFSLPMAALLRADNVACALRRDIVPNEKWNADNWLYQNVRRTGMDSWIQSVRYAANDTWSNLYLARRIDRPEFVVADRDLVDLAISSISWLWANAEEVLPPEALADLSPRQRTVMFMLLDGLSRKKIAARLGIGEDTVNFHVKALYQHFHVQSATELAALFLRNR
jgi:DNA-binding CsgD family transcriptional regulator